MIKDTVAKKLLNQNHLLDLDGFSQSDIQAIFDNTDSMMEVLDRGIRKVPALRGKTVITLFSEASTRTRVSFEQAGKILSADVINVSSDGSSSKKGESLYNTALTLQAMKADAIVVRHQHSGAGYFLAQQMRSTSIINAGDGMHAHPTQSLLDLYTIKKHLGDIGKKATEKNSVKCVWGDAFESIKSIKEDTYDHIFVDLNDDQFCIDLAAKNMDSLVRILKPKGVITAQVGSQDKKPHQVENWLNVFHHHFGNTKLSRVYVPSFDCSWNFSSSINH